MQYRVAKPFRGATRRLCGAGLRPASNVEQAFSPAVAREREFVRPVARKREFLRPVARERDLAPSPSRASATIPQPRSHIKCSKQFPITPLGDRLRKRFHGSGILECLSVVHAFPDSAIKGVSRSSGAPAGAGAPH